MSRSSTGDLKPKATFELANQVFELFFFNPIILKQVWVEKERANRISFNNTFNFNEQTSKIICIQSTAPCAVGN